jgi:hypothetical protein
MSDDKYVIERIVPRVLTPEELALALSGYVRVETISVAEYRKRFVIDESWETAESRAISRRGRA